MKHRWSRRSLRPPALNTGMTISNDSTQAREAARHGDGTFGEQHLPEPDGSLAPTSPRGVAPASDLGEWRETWTAAGDPVIRKALGDRTLEPRSAVALTRLLRPYEGEDPIMHAERVGYCVEEWESYRDPSGDDQELARQMTDLASDMRAFGAASSPMLVVDPYYHHLTPPRPEGWGFGAHSASVTVRGHGWSPVGLPASLGVASKRRLAFASHTPSAKRFLSPTVHRRPCCWLCGPVGLHGGCFWLR